MRIFMYSDLHISRTSSIMPLTSSINKYTYRQNMILELGKYLENIIDEQKPDLIINLGDTFDNHTITSFDIDIASKFFECFRMLNIPHIVLVGNHEMINQDFNAIEILNNINNITVISEPSTVNTDIILLTKLSLQQPNVKLAFLPYCDYRDILEFPDGDFLFSHQDIQGSCIRGDFKLPDGINQNDLSKYKLVFNGHIHKSSIMKNIINVGSISTHSFSDDQENVPKCYIFDTNTLDLTTYKPTCCPLFRKVEIKKNISELYAFMDQLDKNYKYILHIICPFELKDEIKSFIEQNEFVINSRISIIGSIKEVKEENKNNTINLSSNIDILQNFKDFLNITDLKYPLELYADVLKEVK